MTEGLDETISEKGADLWDGMMTEKGAALSSSAKDHQVLSRAEIEQLMDIDLRVLQSPGKEVLAHSVPVPDQMIPALRPIGEKLALAATREFRMSLALLADIDLEQISYLRWGSAFAALPIPSLIAPLQVESGSLTGALVADGACAALYLDCRLGGSQLGPVLIEGGRPYSVIEVALFDDFAQAIKRALVAALPPQVPSQLKVSSVETHPRSVVLGSSATQIARLQFSLAIGSRRGRFDLYLSGPVLAGLEKLFIPAPKERRPPDDTGWRRKMISVTARSSIELDFVLAEVALSLRALRNMKAGDTIPLGINPSSPVIIRSHGLALGKGSIGRAGSMVAVRMLGPLATTSS